MLAATQNGKILHRVPGHDFSLAVGLISRAFIKVLAGVLAASGAVPLDFRMEGEIANAYTRAELREESGKQSSLHQGT